VHFITYRQPFRLPAFHRGIYFHEVDVGRYPLFEYPPYDLALAVRMHEVVRTYGLEVLHLHYAIPHATSAWIAREMLRADGLDVTLVTTLHGTDITLVGQDPSFRPITKFSIERSDRLTAVSEYLRRETYTTFGCSACDVAVIYNFIDPTRYDRSRYADERTDLVRSDVPVVMHVSNFRAVKRVRDVVQIFAQIRERTPCALVMVGDGPDRGEAEAVARALGVDDDAAFLGNVGAVAPLLAHADLFLLPSASESFGLSALEAMACGVPVVGSRVGGLPEVVEDGVTGYLCPVGDVENMAKAGAQLLDDRTRWQEMSEAAARVARERFARDKIVAQYETLYSEALLAARTT
jgi:N-acetyl-alpha-D-glucosaminyl L-malate synthase BshA